MQYYVSKCWRGTKLTVAATQTLTSGGMLLYGLVASGGPASVAFGVVGLACSALLFFDSSKVQNDIVSAIRQNEQSLRAYRVENSRYASENRRLHENVTLLDQSLQKSANEIGLLQKLRSEYVESLQQFERQLRDERAQTESLEEQVQRLDRLRADFLHENQKLQQTVAEAKQHSDSIERLYEQTTASEQAQRAQVDRLKTMVASMQELLTAVANQGDEFQQFSDAIDTRLIEMDRQNESLENTAAVMEALLGTMTRQRFEQLDANKDGLLTADEFASAQQ